MCCERTSLLPTQHTCIGNAPFSTNVVGNTLSIACRIVASDCRHSLAKMAAAVLDKVAYWVGQLDSDKGTQVEKAAKALRNLTRRSYVYWTTIPEAGAIPKLVSLLDSDRGQEAHLAASTLHAIAYRGLNGTLIREAGAIPRLVSLLDSHKGEEAHWAACTLGSLAHQSTNRTAICAAGGIPKLVPLLDSHKGREEAGSAAWALGVLACEDPTIKKLVREAGAIPKLVSLLDSNEKRDALWTAHALTHLAWNDPANATAIREAGGIPKVLSLMVRNKHKTENVAMALRAFKHNNSFCRCDIAVGLKSCPALRWSTNLAVIRRFVDFDNDLKLDALTESAETMLARNIRVWSLVRWRTAVLKHPDRHTLSRAKRIQQTTE